MLQSDLLGNAISDDVMSHCISLPIYNTTYEHSMLWGRKHTQDPTYKLHIQDALDGLATGRYDSFQQAAEEHKVFHFASLKWSHSLFFSRLNEPCSKTGWRANINPWLNMLRATSFSILIRRVSLLTGHAWIQHQQLLSIPLTCSPLHSRYVEPFMIRNGPTASLSSTRMFCLNTPHIILTQNMLTILTRQLWLSISTDVER